MENSLEYFKSATLTFRYNLKIFKSNSFTFLYSRLVTIENVSARYEIHTKVSFNLSIQWHPVSKSSRLINLI